MAIDDFPRGTYEARVTEFPARRTLTEIDGSGTPTTNVKTYDVALAEGTITQEGTPWSPSVMVNLENRISNSIVQIRNECNTKQGTLTAGSGITIDEDNVISATGGGGGSSTLSGLDDVNLSSPTDGQALIYDAASSKWVNANGGSGSATLAGLTDVTLTTPTADQVLKYDGTKWVNGAGGGDATISKTVSGSVCSFSDGADGLPVKELIAQVVAVQEGTGDPSPSNVRPISGRTSVGVTRAGKNLFNGQYTNGNITGNAQQGYTFNTNTTAKSAVIACKPNTQYTVKKHTTSNRFSIATSENQPTNASTVQLVVESAGSTQYTFTTSANANYLIVYVSTSTEQAEPTMQIETGGTASQFEPYNGTTVTIALGQTVYGAELGVTRGAMAITHGYGVFSGSDVVAVGTSSFGVRYAKMSILSDAKSGGNIISSHYKNSNDASHDNSIRLAGVVIYIYDNRFVDLETAQAEVSGVQYCYELAQPVTVQLTPTEIETLLGTNNIWADTGDTTVTYYTSSAEDVIDLVQYDTTKQDKLTAGTGISIDANNVISATGGGGGSTYTAGSNIQISAQNVISAIPQHNIIFGGDNVTASETGGVPYRFSASGIRYVASIGFIVDSNADQGDYIRYWFPVSLSSWLFTHYHLYIRYQVSNYMTNNSVVADTVVEFDGQAATLTLNGAEFSVELTATDLTMSLADSPTDNIMIDSICLTIEDDEGLTWSLRDNIIQEYVQDYVHTVAAPAYTDVTGTLEAGETTLTLTNNKITTNSTIQCFYGADDVDDPSKSVSNGSITLTFSSARQADLAVKVRVS